MVDAMDAGRRRGEGLPCLVVTRMTWPSDDESLAGDMALEDVDANARSTVVVESRVPRLPPVIEPGFGVVVAPEELERSLTDPLARAEHYQIGGRARELHALVGREVVVAQREGLKAGVLGHGGIVHRAEPSRTASR